MSLAGRSIPRYNGSREGGIAHDDSMPALRQSREDPGEQLGVRLVQGLRSDFLAPPLGAGKVGVGHGAYHSIYLHRDGHFSGRGGLVRLLPRRTGGHGAAVGLFQKRVDLPGPADRGLPGGGEPLDGGGTGGHGHPGPFDEDRRGGPRGGHRHDEAVAGHSGGEAQGPGSRPAAAGLGYGRPPAGPVRSESADADAEVGRRPGEAVVPKRLCGPRAGGSAGGLRLVRRAGTEGEAAGTSGLQSLSS